MFKHKKVNASRSAYEKRPDKWFFEKVAKEYTDRELIDFFVSNRLEDRNYVTQLLEDDAVANFTKYKARNQSLSYVFAQNLDVVFKYGAKKPFEIKDEEYPYIITAYLGKNVCPETMVILQDFIHFFEKFDDRFGQNDIIWTKVALKLRRYKPFVKYDRDKFKAILREKIDEVTRG
jgi:hypothetical protein